MAAGGFFLTGAATRVAAGAMARTAAIASECASTISVTGRPGSEKTIDENNHTPFVLWHRGRYHENFFLLKYRVQQGGDAAEGHRETATLGQRDADVGEGDRQTMFFKGCAQWL